MSLNPAGSAPAPLTVFGGYVSEMAPTDLPEGVSPACPDMVLAPGVAQSRPGLQKVFAVAFPQNGAANVATVTGGASYVTDTGTVYNLYLDSNGNLWYEILSSPGNYFNLASGFPLGSYMKSLTAFGRQYIAISDGLHGSDVPLQLNLSNTRGAPLYLDRVTQDGPGTAPTVASIALPSVAMVATTPPGTVAVTECDPAGGPPGGPYGQINFWTSVANPPVSVGGLVSITGNSKVVFNVTNAPVLGVYTGGGGIYATLIVLQAYLPAGTTYGTGGIATLNSGTTMTRSANIVTVKTAAAHQLQPGYQVQITGVPAQAVGFSVSSIVIDNEDFPGLATVTTTAVHGLVPGNFVSIPSISGASVGGGIATVTTRGGITTAITNSNHGLVPGSIVTLAGVSGLTDANVTAVVAAVGGPTVFTFAQTGAADGSGTGGTATLNWPVGQSTTPNYYQVVETPTATTFTVAVNYVDGTFTATSVLFAWNGTFFVLSVPSSTTFTYQQYGPNATAVTVGAVTPYGQVAPGVHQVQVSFLTRNGAITKPSPPFQFVANGGQYLSVSNIPIGPPNVVARILQFTGAGGSDFYYIPVPAQVNGQVVSTATQINDNTTSSILLDFSDNTLYSSIGTSIPGNTLANQATLDGALGFGFYASRLLVWGQRNRIQNLLNMGFGGGYLSSNSVPCGWNTVANQGGALTNNGHFGPGWQVSVGAVGVWGQISQSLYLDYSGAPIATGNTVYTLRAWVMPNNAASGGLTLHASITSASTAFSVTTVINTFFNGTGAFYSAVFSGPTPQTIPSDLTLTIWFSGGSPSTTVVLGDQSLIYTDNPYSDTVLYASYADNPEAFDALTGKLGSTEDNNKIMDVVEIRDTLRILTQDPDGCLHETSDNGSTEPSGWQFNKIASNCGALSAFSLTKSQANSGGEQWAAWASSTGARIYGGGQALKISQEIEPDWSGAASAGALQWSSAPGLNPAALVTAWVLNDPVGRTLYFGLPLGTAGAPSKVFYCSYRELDTAEQIAAAAPIHTSLSGRLIATDHTRKWSPWNLSLNGAARLYRVPGKLQPVFFAGNAQTPGFGGDGYANVYTLNPARYTDDDYGQIFSFYTTYAFLSHDQELALTCDVMTPNGPQKMPIGPGRKLLTYVTGYIAGLGTVTITPLLNALSNASNQIGNRTLSAVPTVDLEWTGGNNQAQRMFIKIASSPTSGTDNWFSLQHLVCYFRRARLQIRGSAQ
jgi:hypothetical protein